MKALKLMLVEDQYIILESLQYLLNNEENLEVTCIAENGKIALENLKNHEVDLIIMDYEMPLMNGYEASLEIKRLYPKIKILILSMYNQFEYTNKLFAAGVNGIILKDSKKGQLLIAIDNIACGNTHFSQDVMKEYLEKKGILDDEKKEGSLTNLTNRELEILKSVAEGKSTEAVAEQYGITIHTVATHRKNIYRKTSSESLPDLIKLAIKLGIASVD